MAVAALALGLGLGACAESNTPDAYGTLTQQNFLETCTNFYFDNTNDTLAITDNTITDASVEPPTQDTCQCMYEVFTGQAGTDENGDQGNGIPDGMPINADVAKANGIDGPNFTDLNSDLKNDPQKAWDDLPDQYKTALDDCTKPGGTDSTSTTTTSAPAGDTTTTTAG